MPLTADACRDGTFFVADGYCNSRIVKFSKDGKYLGEAAFQDGQVGGLAVINAPRNCCRDHH